jgi:thiamine monophosphate synthase
MKNYDFLLEIKKFNYKLSNKLLLSPKLVNSVFFTDRKKISEPEKILSRLPKNSAIIFREYDLPKNERENLAKNFKEKNDKFSKKNCRFIIGKDFALAKKIKADGVHFSDVDKNILPFILQKKSLPKNFIFSLSIHHEKSWALVKKLQPDLVFFSPIFKSSSHINQSPIGLIKFSSLLIKNKYYCCKNKNSVIRIYGLGGIKFSNLKNIRKLGIAGFGAIELFKNFL